MQFYQEALGGVLEITPMPDAQGKPQPDPKAPVMHSQLLIDGKPLLMGTDAQPNIPNERGNTVAIAIDCHSLEEMQRLFAALASNGAVSMPISDMPWRARLGTLTDAFGFHWMLHCVLPG